MREHTKHTCDTFQYPFFSMRYFYIISLITLSLYTTPVVAYAAPTFSVSPLVMDIDAEGRDIIQKEITIKNTGAQPATLYPSVNNISIQDGGTIEKFLPPVESDRTTSLASWIEVSRLGILVRPGEEIKVPITLRVHPTPSAGTYHAFIGFGHGDNRDEAERLVAQGQAPGTIINVTIEEKNTEFLKLSGFAVNRFITNDSNNVARYTFNNPSSESLVPEGEIIIYDSKGKEVGVARVNEDRVEVPPNGEHVFETKISRDGLFGKYKAFLSVEYGSTQRATVQDTSFFYAFPMKYLLILLSGLITMVIFGAWYVHKRYFDDADMDDSERLMVHVREGKRDPRHHDIDLTRNNL